MKIESVQSISQPGQADIIKSTEEIPKSENRTIINSSYLDAETKHALDKATGILQAIVTEKMSDKVIRKMPSDEYLHLLSLLDDIINGSIDKKV